MKKYLGNRVYADFDEKLLTLTLTTNDGVDDTNRIRLETLELMKLTEFMATERRAFQAKHTCSGG